MKRATSLLEFAEAITDFYNEHCDNRRIILISAPEPRGDVEIVLEAKRGVPRQAFTYRADGTFSELSYWTEGQI